jgi:hypothetical protein
MAAGIKEPGRKTTVESKTRLQRGLKLLLESKDASKGEITAADRDVESKTRLQRGLKHQDDTGAS